MFIEAKLKNFRKHVDRTFNFEQGVIALRGANEDGKTTLLEAISYALGGAVMLREPLSEVVTWGQKESTLKVWLTFQINGVLYYITRGKSGAEISNDEMILATGQTEVTKYVETLLGCSVKTATQLMLANQQKLRGTLEEDGAAVKLIEQLADFQLIDRIVALVQKHRPCGTTAVAQARIATLDEQLAVQVVDDTAPLLDVVEAATERLSALQTEYETAKAAYDGVQEPARKAQQRLDAAQEARQAVTVAQSRLNSAQVALDGIKPVPGPAQERIDELRKAVDDAGRLQRAKVAKQALQAVPQPQWEGTYEALQAEHTAASDRFNDLSKAISQNRSDVRVLETQRITETACGLCGKDLSAVPEVVEKNGRIDAQLAALEEACAQLVVQHREADEERLAYVGVINEGRRADIIFQKHAEFITLDRNFTPAKWEWTGPDTSEVLANPQDSLQIALMAQQAYQRDLGRQEQAQAALNAAKLVLNDAAAARDAAEAAVGDAEDELLRASDITSQLAEVEQRHMEASLDLQQATMTLNHAKDMLQMRQQAYDQLKGQLAAAKKDLADMEFNNTLVDTLRKIRPMIVEELWNIVGATVSSNFSTIRGVPSTFLREGDTFTVDGKGIKGLSGSTLDALGLSIRMALTQTFLPNTRFLVLDEPAAAADEDRETNMLGVIASSGFDQVLLVTHSSLCDSFASQVITL